MTYLALVLTMVLWGNSFVATKFILETLSPVQYIFVRFALAALLFIPVLILSRPRRLTFRQHRSLMLVALFEPGLYFLFETYGLRLTTASSASLIIACIPAFVALTAGVVLRERLSRRAWIGIVVSIIGVVAIAILDGAQEAAAGSIPGNLLVLGSVFAATGYIIVARKVSSG
ncbi:MAG: EamA family transporter, partial [Spirochaetaceae bacterium]